MGAANSVDTIDHLVLFDGVCAFCNSSVDFIIRNEKDDTLKFAPLQSKLGQDMLKLHNYPVNYLDSILFLENDRLLNKSSAALSISKYLRRPYSWFQLFEFVPPLIRNIVYWLIAKYRYNIFGKYDTCRVPSPELRQRFFE